MAANHFVEVLKSWAGTPVTIINPQSYTVSKITDGISFESYSAQLTVVAEDFIQVTFAVAWIKRVSIWQNQRYIQL